MGTGSFSRCCLEVQEGDAVASATQAVDGQVAGSARSGGGSGGGGKLKLLCLHGYLQNAEVFRNRIGSMRKALKSRAEFVFLDAPHMATGFGDEAEDGAVDVTNGRSWWQWQDVGPTGRPSRAASYTGWDETLVELYAAIQLHQPDGLLGFSQGATATAMLLATLEGAGAQERLRGVPPPKFAIMVAGFLPRDEGFAAQLRQAAVRTPSYFVHGSADTLVPPERTLELVHTFHPSASTVYCHPGAHLVPTCSGDFKAAVVAFLDKERGGR